MPEIEEDKIIPMFAHIRNFSMETCIMEEDQIPKIEKGKKFNWGGKSSLWLYVKKRS